MALACRLAEQLGTHIEKAGNSVKRPGGMNFLLPKRMSLEAISGILFYAIAAANNGWAYAAESAGSRVASTSVDAMPNRGAVHRVQAPLAKKTTEMSWFPSSVAQDAVAEM